MISSKSNHKSEETVRPASPTSDEDRTRMIAEEAYFRAERRGFEPGQELADWLAAESWLASQNWLATEIEASPRAMK